MESARHYIAGAWIEPDGFDREDVTNPATGAVIGWQSVGDAAVTERAIAAAREAFEASDWARAPRQRALALIRFADRLEAIAEELIALIVRENGKLRAEATFEVRTSIAELRYYAGLAGSLYGRSLESAPGAFSMITREPAGVAAVIVPWNAPAILLIRSLAPALAAGCTVVVKPAPQTPLTNAKIIACLEAVAEIPKGIVNSVNERGSEVGRALVASKEVDVISFTGSSATGKAIMAAAAPTLKRLSLELGGKAPSLVFPDADMDAAVAEITRHSLVIAGQMCVAISRVLVHADIAPAFENRLAAAYRAVRVGPGDGPASQMGALIDQANRDRLLGLIDTARSQGEIVVEGGPLGGAHAAGAFLSPTLYRIADTASPLVQEEHFGPLVSIETFQDEAEAAAMANATRYGLSASIWTRDVARTLRVGRALKTGTVWVNGHGKLIPEAETGGYGDSGLGRLHGVEALADFLETKHLYVEAGADLQRASFH